MTRVTVAVLEGAKEDFLHRHRKDKPRASAAWSALVAKGPVLSQNAELGDPIQRDRWPKQFKGWQNLYRLELPGGFRALYTVQFVQGEGHLVRLDWVGDHKEYDRLFGYSTS